MLTARFIIRYSHITSQTNSCGSLNFITCIYMYPSLTTALGLIMLSVVGCVDVVICTSFSHYSFGFNHAFCSGLRGCGDLHMLLSLQLYIVTICGCNGHTAGL